VPGAGARRRAQLVEELTGPLFYAARTGCALATIANGLRAGDIRPRRFVSDRQVRRWEDSQATARSIPERRFSARTSHF
jgi:hypothetical protein